MEEKYYYNYKKEALRKDIALVLGIFSLIFFSWFPFLFSAMKNYTKNSPGFLAVYIIGFVFCLISIIYSIIKIDSKQGKSGLILSIIALIILIVSLRIILLLFGLAGVGAP